MVGPMSHPSTARRRGPFPAIAVLGSLVLVVAAVLGIAMSSAAAKDSDDYSAEQLQNARAIVGAGAALGLDAHGQAIAVMTAMGESGLDNLDHGDGVLNPDGSSSCSLGLFQQQYCLPGHPWGDSAQQVQDPSTAASMFYAAMVRIPGWESMDPATVAASVQRNRDGASTYSPYWTRAEDLVNRLDSTPSPTASP
jgi:hypothetical protein